MDPALLLLFLRLFGALLLLAFLGVIAWLIYQDMLATQAVLGGQNQVQAVLRPLLPPEEASELFYPLTPVTSIGRATSSTIVLQDDFVSNEHALLTLRGQQWWLEDLNSRNGTLLNDAPLAEATVVSPGDIITIGSTQLKLEQGR